MIGQVRFITDQRDVTGPFQPAERGAQFGGGMAGSDDDTLRLAHRPTTRTTRPSSAGVTCT